MNKEKFFVFTIFGIVFLVFGVIGYLGFLHEPDVYEIDYLGNVERDGETVAVFVNHDKEEVLYDSLTEYQLNYFEKYNLKEGDNFKITLPDFVGELEGCDYQSYDEELSLDCLMVE